MTIKGIEVLERPADEKGPLRGAGVQDRVRPRTAAHLLPASTRARVDKGAEVYNRQGPQGAARPHHAPARQPREGRRGGHGGDIAAGSASRTRPRATPLCDRTQPVVLERTGVPRAGHPVPSSRSQGRPGQAGQALYALSDEDRRSASAPTTRPARTLISGHGRSCTLRCRRTACCASSASTQQFGKPPDVLPETITSRRELSRRHVSRPVVGQFAVSKISLEPTGRRRLRVRRQDHRRRDPRGVHPRRRPGLQAPSTRRARRYPTVDVRPPDDGSTTTSLVGDGLQIAGSTVFKWPPMMAKPRTSRADLSRSRS
jgi:hypothetical protein